MRPTAHEIAAAKITDHYERCWDAVATVKALGKGSTWQLTPGFRILVFSPTDRRNMWTYATCGMSQQKDAPALEIHLFSPWKTDSHVELLTVISHYHLTGAYLDVGHTVNFGRPWLEGSRCDHGLISMPYLDGPKLEWLEAAGRKTRFLWLIPISKDEVDYKKSNGLEALESRFEERQFNYLDLRRSSVV